MRKWFTEWQKLNPILAAGEVGEIIGMLITKTGDGKTPWRALSYTQTPTVDSDPFDVTLTDAEADATSKVEAAEAYAVQRSNHTGVQTSTTISDFTEAVQDAVALLLGAGTNITVNYDDVANTLTIATTAADAEAVRDAIGVALVGVGNISIGVNDALDTITISTTATVNSTDAALRDRSTHSGTQLAATISNFNSAAVLATNGAFVATADGTTFTWNGNPISLGGGSSLTPTAVKTSAYTAAAGDLVPVDTTSGAVTVTLPTAPADKTQVVVKHVTQGGTNAVTVACGGSAVINKAGGATSMTLPLLAQAVILQYKSSTSIWYVLADDLPLTQLDLRHAPIVEAVNTVATSGAAQTIPDVTSSTISRITLSANCTLTFPTAAAGKSFTLVLVQDATGSRTITWPAGVKWPAGTAPSLSTSGGKVDYLQFVCTDGSNWAGFLSGLDVR